MGRERIWNILIIWIEGRNGIVTYFVAIPEHLASVFKATRSPSRIFLTGPRTVAQCSTGLIEWPSNTFHSTLGRYGQLAQLG